jgi:hypothetical protein
MLSTFVFTERFETPSMIPRAVVRIRVQPCNRVGETTVIDWCRCDYLTEPFVA